VTARARAALFAYLRISLAGVALGTWALFVRTAEIEPLWGATLVFGGIASLSALLLLARHSRDRSPGGPPRSSEWRVLLVVGVLSGGATVLYFTAIQRTEVSIAVSAHCLTPAFVAIAAPWVLGTPRRTRSVWFALMAVGGVILIMAPWRYVGGAAQMAAMLGGGAWGAGAALFNSGVLLLNKRLAASFRPEERLAYPALAAAIVLLPIALGFGTVPRDGGAVVLLLIGAAVIGVLGGWLFQRGLDDVPAEHAGILTLWEPITGLLIATFAFGENLGLLGIVGGGVTVLAGILAIREPTAGGEA
jgi:drug/metabolite transporter (DMT)-like permease